MAAFSLLLSVDGLAGDLETALVHYKARRFGDAQPLFEKLVATDPNNPELTFYIGALALRRGDFIEAAKQLERACVLNPKSGHYQNELGDAYGLAAQKAGVLSKLGSAKKCLAAYEKAVALEPTNVEYRLSLMTFYEQAPSFAGGSMAKAYATAEEARKIDPIQGGLALTGLYGKERKWPQAFATLDSLLKAFPDLPLLRYQVGRLAALSGEKLDRGRDALNLYLKTKPEPGTPSWANAHFQLGGVEEKAGNVPAAREAYRTALKLDPSLKVAREALDKIGGGKGDDR